MLTKFTNLVAGYFSGASGITDEGDANGGLRGLINSVYAQANELIDTLTDGLKAVECGSLYVGLGVPGYTGYLPGAPGLVCDGVNNPTVAGIDFVDTALGTRRHVTIANGVVTIV